MGSVVRVLIVSVVRVLILVAVAVRGGVAIAAWAVISVRFAVLANDFVNA